MAPLLNPRTFSNLLERQQWMLPTPSSPIHKISLFPPLQNLLDLSQLSYSSTPNPILNKLEKDSCFYVVRDDLLHPLINGNKARKLDALLPVIQQHSVTDVVTCGGCQSAHAAAVAVSCAERGMRSHLLLRGEQPEIPTGYNLISLMYGNVSYVARSAYAHREDMLNKHADLVAGSDGCVIDLDDILESASGGSNLNSEGDKIVLQQAEAENLRRVVVVREGAGDAVALLGVMRLVKYLSQAHVFGTEQHIRFIIDAGTGTTAIGFALGALCFGLPWKVTAVMLADTIENYKKKERCLISDLKRIHQLEFVGQTSSGIDDSMVHWIERVHSRKFGKVMAGEIARCREIAQQTGILLDPIYTLAAWERAIHSIAEAEKDSKVVMLHTGGTLGLFALAQRYTTYFHNGQQATISS